MEEAEVTSIRRVCHAILEGNIEKTRGILKSELSFVRVEAKERGRIPNNKMLEVFYRDNFTCRYCGRKTVFSGLLRIISHLFPEEFPYHPNWKMDKTHPVFWKLSTSCDHIVPRARGGSDDIENLVTCCYMCNTIKANWTLEELRWTLLEPSKDEWDGLTGLFVKLIEATEINNPYLKGWYSLIKSKIKQSGRK